MFSILPISLLLTAYTSIAAAQFATTTTCYTEYPCPTIAGRNKGAAGVDPHDGTFQQILQYACICSATTFDITVSFTGTDGLPTSETMSTSFPAGSSSYGVFFDVNYALKNTAVSDGSPYTVFNNNYYFGYTYTPVISNYFTTGTYTKYITSTVTTTSTSTETSIFHTTKSQKTATKTCVTGTSTVSAKPSTVSTTSTITLNKHTKPVTTTIHTTETTHSSCVPAHTSQAIARRRDHPLEARSYPVIDRFQRETQWFTYYFGQPEPTTYTTSLDIITANTTTTVTATTLKYKTITHTSTPNPPTTTVCDDVESTITTTSTSTSTIYKTVSASRATITRTSTFVSTIYPTSVKPCKTSPTAAAASDLIKLNAGELRDRE